MVNSYVLVNPHIEGSMNKKVKAKNSIEAAKKLYKNLSEHFNNSVPKFFFSIQKGDSGNGKYYSFKVKEKRNENTVDFSLEPIAIQNEDSAYSKFNKNLNNFRLEQKKSAVQEGGSKHKSNKKPVPKKNSKSQSKKADPFDDDDFMDPKDFYDDDFDLGSDEPNHTTVGYYAPNNYTPIHHYYYDPFLYRMNTFYVPTFYSYLNPFIRINFHP